MDSEDENNKAILVTKLNELNEYTQKGELQNIKTVIEYFYDNLIYNKTILAAVYRSGYKCVTQTEVIISACFHKQVEILDHLLNGTDILDHLTDPSFDVQQVEMQVKTAFRYAICSDNFKMVEMLYDYWCGDVHWTEHNISNMKKLGVLLDAACTELEDRLTKNQQLLSDIRGLVKFNEFQFALYRYLHTLPDSKDNTEEAMLNRLRSVLCIYNKYSNLDFVRWPLSIPERELAFRQLLNDNSSIYSRGTSYIMYEVYFRKLDFNVCSLILENLSVLRKHLCKRFNNSEEFDKDPNLKSLYVKAVSLYEEIECTLYHYIYRTSEDWRLYLPGGRQPTLLKNRVGYHKGKIYNLKLEFDSYKVYNGPVLYLERLNFERCVNELKELLQGHVMSTNPVPRTSTSIKNVGNPQKKKSSSSSLMDNNYLKQAVYMRDYYSLRKIVNYVEALEKSNEINISMIERVLQVIGEMLKCTEESQHLSPSTKALLHTAIPVEAIGHLHNIRKYLARVEEGQITTRINIASSQDKIFGEVKQDLIEFLQIVYPILDIYKFMLDKSLLKKGLQLLDTRIEILPAEGKQYTDIIYDHFKSYGKKFETNFMEAVWKHTGLTRQLLREIPWIQNNRDELSYKKRLASNQITSVTVVLLPIYIGKIEQTLNHIRENNIKVAIFNKDLYLDNMHKLTLYPNTKDIKSKRDSILKQQKRRNQNFDLLLQRLNDIKDLKQWESVKSVLNFFICELECDMFDESDAEFVKKIDEPDEQTLDNVNKLLLKIKTVCAKQRKKICDSNGLLLPTYPNLNKSHSFDAIKKLDNDIFVKNKIENDRAQREQLLLCLKDRLDHLRTILEYPKHLSLSQYLVKYKSDQKFRFQLEMLLGDIANILVRCKIRLMYKSNKLLKEIDLGNVLDHGNPFLDVIGEFLDSRDFPSALLSKAIMFANDRDAVVALYELFKENIELRIIRDGNKNGMNDNQKKYLDQFKMCDKDRQETYLKLIFIYNK